jgi:nucleotide-binding universal stress UspA family protein
MTPPPDRMRIAANHLDGFLRRGRWTAAARPAASIRAALRIRARMVFRKICGVSLPAGWYHARMSTILVPIDFSEETPEVIECAAMLARRNRSQLVLMHVAAGGREVAPGVISHEEEAEATDKLDRLERYLRDEGYEVSTALRAGEPAREIVEYGDAIKADCIIMGKHDHAPAATRAKSPVTRYVEQKAPCTVVAVP